MMINGRGIIKMVKSEEMMIRGIIRGDYVNFSQIDYVDTARQCSEPGYGKIPMEN